jgi:eukaryotic-like serine/threonine-protein kinase
VLIGKRLNDRYKILEIIGGGGMANVYLARDIILEREVAIKVLRLDFANDEEFIKRFRREALSATSLDHPNIVSIYDVGEEDDIYYIVMEYVDGQTLKQYIQQHAPLTPEESIDIMMQLTSAISHAHQNGIIHRDIKPQNILIDRNKTVKITDFGIAMALSSTTITHTNSVLGSVHYLSPEQARGGIATEKSDIYALGIVMFELLTGRPPFSGESAISIALKHLQSETPSPKRWNALIPQSVENIILKATAKDPFHRYQTAVDMEEDLKTALDPSRMNEEKFTIPLDDDEITKAIPIIGNGKAKEIEEKTIIRQPNENPDSSNGEESKQKIAVHKDGLNENGKKKRSKLAVFLMTTFLLLIISGIAAVTVIHPLLIPKDVKVPDVSEMEYEDAVQELVSKGFKINDPVLMPHDTIPEGYVIKTDPKANEMVKEGSSITIYESTGKKKVKFGKYIGRNIDEVESILERKNFLMVRKNEVYDEEPAGTIIDQSIDPEEEVIPEETEVTFWVSKGPEKITLKDFTGWTEKTVRDYITENGLYVIVEKQFSDSVDKGLVISQIPAAGTKLDKGDTVTITISQGKEEKPTKTVTKSILIPYEPEVEGEVKKVNIYIEDAEHSMTEIYDSFEITKPVTKTITFIIPYGKKAGYQIIIDDKVVKSEVIEYPQ